MVGSEDGRVKSMKRNVRERPGRRRVNTVSTDDAVDSRMLMGADGVTSREDRFYYAGGFSNGRAALGSWARGLHYLSHA